MAWSIKAARVNAGYTQKDAAEVLGVSEKTVCNWEKGIAVPMADKFVEMCRLYGVSMDDIILPSKSS